MRPPLPFQQQTIRPAGGTARALSGGLGLLTALMLTAAQPNSAPAQTLGNSKAGAAVASDTYGGKSAVHIPTFGYSRYGPGGRTRFSEGSGYFRPYMLSPRPVYRLEVSPQPVRRSTFSLGYISHGGFGSYYY